MVFSILSSDNYYTTKSGTFTQNAVFNNNTSYQTNNTSYQTNNTSYQDITSYRTNNYTKTYNYPTQTNIQTIQVNVKNDIDGIITRNNLIKTDVSKYLNKKPLIIHCCHHKTGTVVIEKILRSVCNKFGLKYQYCNQEQLESNTDVWLEHHSKIDFSLIDRPIIGTHMIRNPFSLIVSAYEYHKTTIEPWANRKIKKYNGLTYKEVLNQLNSEEGLLFEIKNDLCLESSKNTIMDMYNWDYRRPNFLELKFEDLMTNFDGTLANMFKHYGFTREMIDTSLVIAASYNLRNKNDEELKKNKHVTNKSLDLEKWRNYYGESILRKFWKVYPEDLFNKIGYIDDLKLKDISELKTDNKKDTIENISDIENKLENNLIVDDDEPLNKNEIEKLISIVGKESISETNSENIQKKISTKLVDEKVNKQKENIWKMFNGEYPFMMD